MREHNVSRKEDFSMSKQYKKLQHKLAEQKKPSDAKKKPQKVGKDYFLVAVIFFTIFIASVGWMQFDWLNRGMYVLLATSMILMYIDRHAKLSDSTRIYVKRFSSASIGIAVALFVIILWNQFFA